MGSIETIFYLLVAFIALCVPVAVLILSIVAFVRTGRIKILESRIQELERRLQSRDLAAPAQPSLDEEVIDAEAVADESAIHASAQQSVSTAERPPIQWELLIGQKAFGWVAVVLSIFTAAFFLKYAYENNWIGPVGRVAIGVLAGTALMVVGHRYYRQGAAIFSQMLAACGVVVLYLSAYSSFGFYSLLPAEQAGVFLALIVVLSMACAILYDSLAIALMAVLGGLATPLLLPNEHDLYVAFFVYLVALNLGVLFVTLARRWKLISAIAFLGTHGLFWSWYAGNYHPEKWKWALTFQAVIFGMYLIQNFAGHFSQRADNRRENIVLTLLNAACWFGAFYVLMEDDYREWMGAAAVAMAAVYVTAGRLLLAFRPGVIPELVSAIAISVGFVALAIPLQADSSWIALGWAATATAMWWFHLRIESRVLGVQAAALAVTSAVRVAFVDLPSYPSELFLPIVNKIALPSIGVVVCIAAAYFVTRAYRNRLSSATRNLIAAAGLGAIVLLWVILTVDLSNFFSTVARTASEPNSWRRIGFMSVSILWTVYASILLAFGFRLGRATLRWTGIAFFVLTIGKVLLLDMSGLSEIYRILAFFILAVFLGVAARVYQRLKPSATAEQSEEVAASHE